MILLSVDGLVRASQILQLVMWIVMFALAALLIGLGIALMKRVKTAQKNASVHLHAKVDRIETDELNQRIPFYSAKDLGNSLVFQGNPLPKKTDLEQGSEIELLFDRESGQALDWKPLQTTALYGKIIAIAGGVCAIATVISLIVSRR
jgi:hypothetical protein